MLNKLHQLREERAEGDKGFTLIELLVVVVIIGILIAIAIPLYLNYQKGAKNKSAQSDTRNAIAVIEQCYADAGNTYPASSTADVTGTITLTCGTGNTQKINISPGNKMTYTLLTGGATYSVLTKAGSPGSASYTYTSADGQTATS